MALEAFEARKKRESVPSIMGMPRNDDQILNSLLEAFSAKRRSYDKLDEPFEEKSRAYEKFLKTRHQNNGYTHSHYTRKYYSQRI